MLALLRPLHAHTPYVIFVGFLNNNTTFCLLISLNKYGGRKFYAANVKRVALKRRQANSTERLRLFMFCKYELTKRETPFWTVVEEWLLSSYCGALITQRNVPQPLFHWMSRFLFEIPLALHTISAFPRELKCNFFLKTYNSQVVGKQKLFTVNGYIWSQCFDRYTIDNLIIERSSYRVLSYTVILFRMITTGRVDD